jgi:uncharacterized membrane protein YfcA
MIDAAVAILLGVAIGVFSGLFGVGGSSISTPLLRIALGTSPFIALASPLPVTLPTALSGSIVYRREGLINGRAAAWAIAGGLPTVVAGSLLTSQISAHWLMYLVALSVLFAGVQMYRSRPLAEVDGQVPTDARWANPSAPLLVSLAAIIGFLSGLLANGGGFLLVPVFVLLFGARLREAAATSLPCVAAMAVPGTITHALLGHVSWLLALELSIGVVPATYLGAWASMWLRNVRLRKPFGVFMAVFGVYFFFREMLVA